MEAARYVEHIWSSASCDSRLVQGISHGWRLWILETDGTQTVAEPVETLISAQRSEEDVAPELLAHRKQIVRQIADRDTKVAALALRISMEINWQRDAWLCVLAVDQMSDVGRLAPIVSEEVEGGSAGPPSDWRPSRSVRLDDVAARCLEEVRVAMAGALNQGLRDSEAQRSRRNRRRR